RAYYDEITLDFDNKNFEEILANMRDSFCDIEKFVAENRDKLESYRTYKQTQDYKATPMYLLEEALKQFNSTSGYNDIFIPAMCQLSEAYNQYYKTLQKANEQFLQMYPDWGGQSR
ncbi:MAG: MerR family transcriptional regulator, partial [Lachnospiraceae bacterium]|nr:MerR family transcriptional regulator [Lachnospiraceae bacterium]